MKPILFNSNEKDFDTQGIGVLVDAISCIVTEERNSTFECEMEYPIDGIHYEEIKLNNILYVRPSDGANPQAFRIYEVTRPINGVVTVSAEHISYQLSNIPVQPFTATGAIEAVHGLKVNSLEDNPFEITTDSSNGETVYKQEVPASFRSRLGGVDGSILDCFGGEYEWDMWTVKHHAHRGTDRGVIIEYGKNLTSVKQEELISNVVTGVLPYWISNDDSDKELLMLEPIQSEYADKYPFRRTVVHDFSQDFENKPTEEQLKAKCETYIKNNCVGMPKISIDAEFVNLADTEEYKNIARERINLCDTVTIRFLKLGIDEKAKVTKIEYDCLAERIKKISIGSERSNFVKTISDIQNEIKKDNEDQGNKFADLLKKSLEYQKKLMDGGFGGHVITNNVNGYPSEIIIGDTDNIETMKNCIRINMNGIAFSQNGYDGEYTTAWTIDGKLNADFIQAGTINGNLIKSGTIVIGTLDEEVTQIINNATNTANEANNKAENASNSADEAINKANNAQSSANDANDMSQKAYDEAQKAQEASEEANKLANNAWQGIDDLSQIVVADSTGVKVKEAKNSNNYSHIRSDGMHVLTNNKEVAKFGVDSHINNLAVSDYMMFGAHRAEMLVQNSEQGTAFYHVGDIQ